MKQEETLIPDEQAEMLCNEIFECFLHEDAEQLESMFSISVQKDYELAVEIQEAFEFVEGLCRMMNLEALCRVKRCKVLKGQWSCI